MCLGCVIGPFAGSFFGNTLGAFAWNPKRPLSHKILTVAASTTLTVMTSLAIKSFFNVSFCGPEGMTIVRGAVIVAGSGIVGIIYSFGLNYLLNRFVPVPPRCPRCVH